MLHGRGDLATAPTDVVHLSGSTLRSSLDMNSGVERVLDEIEFEIERNIELIEMDQLKQAYKVSTNSCGHTSIASFLANPGNCIPYIELNKSNLSTTVITYLLKDGLTTQESDKSQYS